MATNEYGRNDRHDYDRGFFGGESRGREHNGYGQRAENGPGGAGGYGRDEGYGSGRANDERGYARDASHFEGRGSYGSGREQEYGRQSGYGQGRQYVGQQGTYGDESDAYGRASYGREQGQYGRGGSSGQSGEYGLSRQSGQTSYGSNWGGQSGGYGQTGYGSEQQYGGRESGQFGYGQSGYRSQESNQGGLYGQYGMGSQQNRGRNPDRKGPKGYQMSDDRIKDEVCRSFMQSQDFDPSEIEVEVKNGEVTLKGEVEDREDKFMAERAAERVLGVKDVHNTIRCTRGQRSGSTNSGHSESKQGSESELSSTRGSTMTAGKR